MGIRETVNKNPAITTGATIAIIVIALACIIWQLIPNRPSHGSGQAYFTVDDGANWFADDATKVPPFDHDGKEAVKAYVYKCDKTTFVAYLEKFTDEAKQQMAEAMKGNRPNPMMFVQMGPFPGRLVKKPGDGAWVSGKDFQALQKITEVKCPDGGTNIEAVYP